MDMGSSLRILAQAVGIPVGWRLGSPLATPLVSTINEIIMFPSFVSPVSPLLSTFLIEGGSGSNTYFAKYEAPKNLAANTFLDLVSPFGAS